MFPAPDAAERFWDLPGRHVHVPIERVTDYPLLAACLEIWRAASTQGLPRTLDPVDLPREVITGISLVDWNEDRQDWVIRLAAGLIESKRRQPTRGSSLSETFTPADRDTVRAEIDEVVRRAAPDLRRREFTDRQGLVWSYVRLLLPLSNNGLRCDSYALIIDPRTFGRRVTPSPD